MVTWEMLIEAEPKLLDLYNDARKVKDDGTGKYFCGNEFWYEVGGLKDRLLPLVGWERFYQDGDASILSTREAYDLAYRKIYNALPNCRGNCNCL